MKVVAVFCRYGKVIASIKSDARIEPHIVDDDKIEMRNVVSTFRNLAYNSVGKNFILTLYKNNQILLEREMKPQPEDLCVDVRERELQFESLMRSV